MDPRLILIEGMVGAGKATTAQWMERWLVGRGEDARAFHEFAADHPVRSKAVDLLRAAYPEPAWSPDDVGEDGLARDRRVYEVEQWGRLAQLCRQTGRTVILESTFLQNWVMPAFTMGAPVEKLIDIADMDREADGARAAPARPPAAHRYRGVDPAHTTGPWRALELVEHRRGRRLSVGAGS